MDKELKNELMILYRKLYGIDQIEVTSALFNRIKLNRNNRFYGFIMNVCQIINDSTFPAEEQGKYQFSDFTRDDNNQRGVR